MLLTGSVPRSGAFGLFALFAPSFFRVPLASSSVVTSSSMPLLVSSSLFGVPSSSSTVFLVVAFLGHFTAATFTAVKRLSPSSFGLPLPLLLLAGVLSFYLMSFLFLFLSFRRIFVVVMLTGVELAWC